MSKIYELLFKLKKDESGAAMAEYVVLVGLIVGALVLVITHFTDVLHSRFSEVCAALAGSC